jgi:hypothetical protein
MSQSLLEKVIQRQRNPGYFVVGMSRVESRCFGGRFWNLDVPVPVPGLKVLKVLLRAKTRWLSKGPRLRAIRVGK